MTNSKIYFRGKCWCVYTYTGKFLKKFKDFNRAWDYAETVGEKIL